MRIFFSNTEKMALVLASMPSCPKDRVHPQQSFSSSFSSSSMSFCSLTGFVVDSSLVVILVSWISPFSYIFSIEVMVVVVVYKRNICEYI